MSSPFYTSIASYYQHIFPFNPEQIEFLRNVLPYNGARVLDVGCSTGDLAFALTHFGFPVWAIDSDLAMIQRAQGQKDDDVMFPVFSQLDMQRISQQFPTEYFDTVICFGNTLVHLPDDVTVLNFLKAAHQVLNSEGKLAIQILNYQYILENQIRELPLIDNEHVRFDRKYRFSAGSDLVDFETHLLVKSTSQEISNSVQLYALTREKLEFLLTESGFGELSFFGGFKSDPLQKDSLRLVVVGRKK